MKHKLESGKEVVFKDLSIDERDELMDSVTTEGVGGDLRITAMHSTMTKFIRIGIKNSNDKFIKSMDSLNKEGKIVETKQGQIDDTIKSCFKVITKQLDIIDTHERGDIITKVVEHIQQLTWFNNHCLPKQDIKLFGLVLKDAIQINHVANKKKVAIK